MAVRRSLRERFEEKVSPCPITGCWWWTSSTNNRGYGVISIRDYPHLAHRVAFEMYVGCILVGMFVLHSCDNGHLGCVNPDHLRVGTHAVNMQQMARRGRSARKKLTDDDVREVRRLVGRIGMAKIAMRFGVTKRAIQFLVRGAHHRHVE